MTKFHIIFFTLTPEIKLVRATHAGWYVVDDRFVMQGFVAQHTVSL